MNQVRELRLTLSFFLFAAGVSALKAEKGLALQDIIQGIYEFASEVTFSAPTRVYFLDQLSQVE